MRNTPTYFDDPDLTDDGRPTPLPWWIPPTEWNRIAGDDLLDDAQIDASVKAMHDRLAERAIRRVTHWLYVDEGIDLCEMGADQ